MDANHLSIVPALTVSFILGSILGFASQRMKMSPILGYLFAGYIVGPYSPGIFIDVQLSEQLAEIGVVLMMFGVGMHFKWQDLAVVRHIAVVGAVGQTLVASTVGALLIYYSGYPIEMGIIVGLAISVASTVVLVRVLSDNDLLHTPQGHVAIGWLIVEDIITIALLILLPTFAEVMDGMQFSLLDFAIDVAAIALKLVLMALLLFTCGKSIASFILFEVARTRSHELFTLTVLALIFAIALGSAVLFGTSIALGAFIAGMIIGQTDVKHQASANALPIRDAFVVLFFLSVGMLFNPSAIASHFLLFSCVLMTVLVVKPLAAYLIVIFMRQPMVVAITVALALSQIGEFSFILAEEALKLKILPDEGYDIIVAVGIISLALNPLLFRFMGKYEFASSSSTHIAPHFFEDHAVSLDKTAVVVGCGHLGQIAVELLEKDCFHCLIVDRNVDVIAALQKNKKQAIFGDFSHPSIMEAAKIDSADLLVITISDITVVVHILEVIKLYNYTLPIIVRINFMNDLHLISGFDVDSICMQEEEHKGFRQKFAMFIDNKFSEEVLSGKG